MNAEINAATKKWNEGDKVVLGRTCMVDEAWATGLVGTVNFEYDTLVYVNVVRPGKRKPQSLTFHRDELTLAS
jgi:hypothetical protein